MKAIFSDFFREISEDITSSKLLPSLSAGAISGLGLLATQISFGSLIFSGSLTPFVSLGIGLILFGNFVTCLILALASGYRGVIAGLFPVLVLGMVDIAGGIDTSGDALFVSACVALILSACLTGVVCMTIGLVRVAEVLRFIPYPVTAGFVSGIGGAVCLIAFSLIGTPVAMENLTELVQIDALVLWVPGVTYGVFLYWSMKRWRKPILFPISLFLVISAYHLALSYFEISLDDARSLGFLVSKSVGSDIWPAFGMSDLGRVNWSAVVAQIPNMLVLVVVALIAIVMNIAGLEVSTNQELDWDSEFKIGGATSVLAGLGGGTVSTIVVPASVRSKLLGASSRLTGITAALVIAFALFFGGSLLELVPTPILGSVLVFAGLGMIEEGFVRSYRRLPKSEFLIVVLMVIAIIGFGLIEAVAVGMLAMLAFFAFRLSAVDSIESHSTIRDRRSSKTRTLPDRAILHGMGSSSPVIVLRGYIFFGSVNPLTKALNAIVAEKRCVCVILDCTAVSGVDYSAISVRLKWVVDIQESGTEVVLANGSKNLIREFQRDLTPQAFSNLLISDVMDQALELAEDRVIKDWSSNHESEDNRRRLLLDGVAARLERELSRQIEFEELTEDLKDMVDILDIDSGEVIYDHESGIIRGLQMIQNGTVSAFDESGVRLFQIGVGEVIETQKDRTASVATLVADIPCRMIFLSRETIEALELNQQELTIKLYRYMLDTALTADS